MNKRNSDEQVVLRLAKIFRKLYVETDCQTKLSLHDVNMMIRDCFGFKGDNLETGDMILNLTVQTKRSGDKS